MVVDLESINLHDNLQLVTEKSLFVHILGHTQYGQLFLMAANPSENDDILKKAQNTLLFQRRVCP
jgi:hypothetical protein